MFHPQTAPTLLVLLLLALTSCVSSGTGPEGEGGEPSGGVAALDVEQGADSAMVGSTIPFAILLTDAAGNAVEGATVRWAASEGASVDPAESASGADGLASTAFTLGTTPQRYQVTATAGDLPALTMDVHAGVAEAATIVLSTDSIRFTEAGQTERLTAAVTDPFGNAIESPSLQWTSSNPSVATVEDGLVTSVDRGTVTITATSGEATGEAAAYVIPYGYFTVTFDDGFESTYTIAYPALAEAGLRGNVAVNPLAIDQKWETYLTLGQLTELHAQGWGVVNHTMTHPRLSELSAAEMEAEIVQARNWIDDHGFRGSSVFIVPYHNWGEREIAVIRRYHAAARGHSSNPPWLVPFQTWPAQNPYMLTGFEPEVYEVGGEKGFGSEAVRQEIVRRLDGVIERGEVVDIFFHGILPGQEAAFGALAALLGERSDRFRTYAELFPEQAGG